MPTQERLRELFIYDEELGLLLRKTCWVCGTPNAPVYSYHNEGYLTVRVDGDNRLMHRMIWIYLYGNISVKKEIDHIDGNRSNNKIGNLRLVDKKTNSRNSSLRSNNTSGVVGVYWSARDCRWRAQIGFNGTVIPLGAFLNKQDAINVRKQAESVYGFHRNHGKSAKLKVD